MSHPTEFDFGTALRKVALPNVAFSTACFILWARLRLTQPEDAIKRDVHEECSDD